MDRGTGKKRLGWRCSERKLGWRRGKMPVRRQMGLAWKEPGEGRAEIDRRLSERYH